MTNKEIFTHYRFRLSFQKFPKYLKYAKELYPNYDLHHLCGSVRGKKFTDALIYPLPHEEHITQAEYNKADYFVRYFHQSVAIFVKYARNKLNYKDNLNFTMNPDTGLYRVEEIAEFIEKVHKLENNNG